MIIKVFATMILSVSIIAMPVLSFGQGSPKPQNYLDKLETHDILAKAQSGVRQELIVQLEQGTIFADWEVRRQGIEDNRARNNSKLAESGKKDNDEAAKRAQAEELDNYNARIAALKASTFQPLERSGVTVVRDFPHIAKALVAVSNVDALTALLQSANVKRVSIDHAVSLSANWPTSYSDLSLIGETVDNSGGSQGVKVGAQVYTGAGTVVAVLDTVIDVDLVPMLPGHSPIQCSTQSVYARNGGGTDFTTGCRFAGFGLYPPGGDPSEPAAGTAGSCYWGQPNIPSTCPKSQWQHGTLDSQIIARTAPGAWLLGLEVFDGLGNSKESWITSQLDWLVSIGQQQKAGTLGWAAPLVALNISVALDSTTKYSSSCASAPGASELSTLISLGITPVVATGNQGWIDGVNAPACVPGVVSVGAVTDSATPYYNFGAVCSMNASNNANKVGCFTNRSSSLLSVYAPGVFIGDATVGSQWGTSMAAPHVAGEVAILRSQAGGMAKTVSQISSLIINNGTPISDTYAPANRIDIAKALGATASPPQTTAYSMQLVPTTAPPIPVGQGFFFAFNTFAQDGSSVGNPTSTTQVWRSSNPAIFTTTTAGSIVAVSEGTAVLTLSDPLVTLPTSTVVTVVAASKLTALTATPASVSINVSTSLTISATGQDQYGNTMTLTGTTWTSANPAVASVNSLGQVVGVGVGSTTLTATSGGLSVTIPVSISSRPGIGPPHCGRECSASVPSAPRH